MAIIHHVSFYVGTGSEVPWDPRRPASNDLGLKDWVDVTDRPTPGLGDLLIVESVVTLGQLTTLVADPAHGTDSICHRDSNVDDVPTLAQLTALRTFLASKGLTVANLTDSVGDTVAGRTRRQIARALARWLRNR